MEIIVVLDNIRSMHNIGSIFRSCDSMGNCSVFLCGICATPPSKEIHKTALGSTESVPWKYYKTTKEAVIELKKNNYEIIAVEQINESISLNQFQTQAKKIALIFGNEVKGVNKDIINLSDKCIEINQYGIKQSMNVSVAAGVVLWAIRNK
jgi:23S rRNA (guanosine2251-2'-O)-methyltransferase